MNDFTKEELEELHFFAELHKNKYQIKHPEELINKIQSMIDNYDKPKEYRVTSDDTKDFDKEIWKFNHGFRGLTEEDC